MLCISRSCCVLQAMLQDFSAGLGGIEPLLHADGLAADNSPVVNFHDALMVQSGNL